MPSVPSRGGHTNRITAVPAERKTIEYKLLEGKVIAALKSGIGAMPSYRGSLSDEQMRALARYVSKASGGAR